MADAKKPKVTLDSEPQDMETTTDMYGETVNDELASQFYEDVAQRNEKSTVWHQMTFEQRYYLIDSVSEEYIEDGTSANALSYAIHRESYSLVQQMLDELKLQPQLKQMAPIFATDEEGNNALQKLIWVIEHRAMSSSTERVLVKKILSTLMTFDLDFSLLTHENERGQTPLTQALLCTKEDYNQTLFINLMKCLAPESKIEAIGGKKKKCDLSECKNERKSRHSPGCTADYNLLMLALTSNNSANIAHILHVVGNATDKAKEEIVLGDSILARKQPNSIRVAARNQEWQFLDSLLLCVDGMNCDEELKNFADVLLDEDERLESAMKWILRAQETSVVKSLLELQNFKLRNDLDRALTDSYGRGLFTELEMSVAAIKAFYAADLFEYLFLLPKPSHEERFSQPKAMVCYNTFDYDKEMKVSGTKKGAEAIRKALESLGWQFRDGDCIPKWNRKTVLDNIRTQLQRCRTHASIFLLCITTHGKDDKATGERPSHPARFDLVPINKIVDVVVKNTDPLIPKVLIIDVCRIKKDTVPEPIVLKNNNVLLLLGTSYEQEATAGLYLRELAKEIRKAGSLTLEAMHDNVAIRVKKISSKPRHVEQATDANDLPDGKPTPKPTQVPQKIGTTRGIILRNWLQKPVVCMIQGHDQPMMKCNRCPENVCPVCIEIDGYDDDLLSHGNVRFYCSRCCEIVDRMQ